MTIQLFQVDPTIKSQMDDAFELPNAAPNLEPLLQQAELSDEDEQDEEAALDWTKLMYGKHSYLQAR